MRPVAESRQACAENERSVGAGFFFILVMGSLVRNFTLWVKLRSEMFHAENSSIHQRERERERKGVRVAVCALVVVSATTAFHQSFAPASVSELSHYLIGCSTVIAVSYTHLTLPTNREV